MGASGGPNMISDGLVFALDAADPQTSKAGCMGFASAEQLMKNLATNSGNSSIVSIFDYLDGSNTCSSSC